MVVAWETLAQQGFSFFPVKARSKTPAVDWKVYQERKPTPEEVSRWSRNPTYNAGVVTGAISGIVVLEHDTPEGEQEIARLGLPPTPRVRTARGVHFYLRAPSCPVKNFAKKIPGCDFRGDGGFVVAAGSVHETGHMYRWEVSPFDVPYGEMPEWLLRLTTTGRASLVPTIGVPDRMPAPANQLPVDNRFAQACLEGALSGLRRAKEGTRNDRLNATAYHLGAKAEAGLYDRNIVRDRLLATATEIGLSEEEAAKTIDSGLYAGLSRMSCGQVDVDAANANDPADASISTLMRGSDVEIAEQALRRLMVLGGTVVFVEGQFWRYAETHWVAVEEPAIRALAREFDGASYPTAKGFGRVLLSKSRIDSIIHEMSSMAARPAFFSSPARGINCLTGFVTVNEDGTAVLKPHDPDHRRRHVLPGRWPLDDVDTVWSDSLLSRLLAGSFRGDVDMVDKLNVLGEIAGCAALGYGTSLGQPKAIILSGPSAENGKSQVLEILEGLLPKDAVCSIPLGKFGEERYLPQLAGKSLNTAGELTSAATIASDVFKTVITGEPITGRDVYRSAVTFRPMAIHVFATNDLPGFRVGMDRGVRRRLLVVTFNRTIPEAERIVGIGRRITTEEADLLLHFAVEGACRLVRTGRFTEPASSGAALKDWMYGSDPVLAWLEEAVTVTSGRDAPAIPTKTAYAHFRAFALSEGYRADGLPAVNNFVQRVLAGDGRIERGRRKEGGRFLKGIALKDPSLAERFSPTIWRG